MQKQKLLIAIFMSAFVAGGLHATEVPSINLVALHVGLADILKQAPPARAYSNKLTERDKENLATMMQQFNAVQKILQPYLNGKGVLDKEKIKTLGHDKVTGLKRQVMHSEFSDTASKLTYLLYHAYLVLDRDDPDLIRHLEGYSPEERHLLYEALNADATNATNREALGDLDPEPGKRILYKDEKKLFQKFYKQYESLANRYLLLASKASDTTRFDQQLKQDGLASIDELLTKIDTFLTSYGLPSPQNPEAKQQAKKAYPESTYRLYIEPLYKRYKEIAAHRNEIMYDNRLDSSNRAALTRVLEILARIQKALQPYLRADGSGLLDKEKLDEASIKALLKAIAHDAQEFGTARDTYSYKTIINQFLYKDPENLQKQLESYPPEDRPLLKQALEAHTTYWDNQELIHDKQEAPQKKLLYTREKHTLRDLKEKYATIWSKLRSLKSWQTEEQQATRQELGRLGFNSVEALLKSIVSLLQSHGLSSIAATSLDEQAKDIGLYQGYGSSSETEKAFVKEARSLYSDKVYEDYIYPLYSRYKDMLVNKDALT